MDNNINTIGKLNNNENYQKEVAKKSEEILAGKDTISINELKNKPLFQDAFKNLSEEQKETAFDNISKIANLDNNQEISKEELNAILTLMDANFDAEKKEFTFDKNFEISENGALLNVDIEPASDKMSRKEAQDWVKNYMEQTGCTKKDAYKAFEQNFGYKVPKNIWGKIGDGFKVAVEFILALSFAIASGNETTGNK